MSDEAGRSAPLLSTRVAREWLDYNGHMNDAAYAVVFSRAVDALMDRIGLDAAARAESGQTLFTLQMMLHYFREAREGAPLAVEGQILEFDDKRLRIFLTMREGAGGARLAASEQLLLSIAKTDAPRAVPWRSETLAALAGIFESQRLWPAPAEAGRGIRLKREG